MQYVLRKGASLLPGGQGRAAAAVGAKEPDPKIEFKAPSFEVSAEEYHQVPAQQIEGLEETSGRPSRPFRMSREGVTSRTITDVSLLARKGKRGNKGMANPTAVSLVPALRLTTTISKTFRWALSPGITAWTITFTDTILLHALVARVTSASYLPLFTAFRLKQVRLYIVPLATSNISPRSVPQIAWVTAGTTSGIDSKPDDVVPAITDLGHVTIVSMTPNPKSSVSFWADEANGDPYFVVFGDGQSAPGYSAVLDVDLEYTLPDAENQPVVQPAVSVPSSYSQRNVTGTGSGSAVVIGYSAYNP